MLTVPVEGAVFDTFRVKNPSRRLRTKEPAPLGPIATQPSRRGRARLAHLSVMDVQILTGQDVAELLKVSPRTIEEWRQTHHGPPWRRVGKHVRYVEAEVVAWFEGLDPHA